jgi:hypothetical protein
MYSFLSSTTRLASRSCSCNVRCILQRKAGTAVIRTVKFAGVNTVRLTHCEIRRPPRQHLCTALQQQGAEHSPATASQVRPLSLSKTTFQQKIKQTALFFPPWLTH